MPNVAYSTELSSAAIQALESVLLEVRRITRSNSEDLRVLAKLLADKVATLPNTPDYRKQRRAMEALLKEVRGPITRTFNKLDERTRSNIFSIVKKEGMREVLAMSAVLRFDLTGAAISLLERRVSTLLVEGVPMSEWWMKQSSEVLTKLGTIVNAGVREGRTGYDIAKQIMSDDAFELIGGTRARAEAVARTATISTLNDYKLDSYRANSDVIGGLQWLAVLDARTTVVCKRLDGLIWDLNLQPVGHSTPYPGPIAHWNCRSTQIPVLKTFAEMGINVPEFTGDEFRAAEGGPQIFAPRLSEPHASPSDVRDPKNADKAPVLPNTTRSR